MANIFFLLVIAFGGTFAICWTIHYLPLYSKILGMIYSPRLALCKLLAPLDAALTFVLIGGAWIGLTTSVVGINLMVYNVLTGLGISGGVVFLKKVLVPKWTKQYEQICLDIERSRI
jgi:hypothetical protein